MQFSKQKQHRQQKPSIKQSPYLRQGRIAGFIAKSYIVVGVKADFIVYVPVT